MKQSLLWLALLILPMLAQGSNTAARLYAEQAQKLNNGEYSKEIA